jgi:hypothetical protein
MRLPGKALAAFAVLAALFAPAAASAETVDTLADSGPGSLRSAVAAGGTVTFAPALSGTILLDSELLVDKDVTIDGPSDRSIVISGQDATRVIKVLGAGADVSIDDVTIRDGRVDGTSDPLGAGIWFIFGDSLRLERVAVLSSTAAKTDAVFPLGGGIAVLGGHFELIDSTVADNDATDGSAGGVFVGTPASFTIANSTIAGNRAAGGGGLVSGNAAGTVTSSTIARNEGTAEPGGGIQASGPAVVTLQRSLVAGNTASTAPDCLGVPESGGDNVIGSLAGCGLVALASDVTGAAPVGQLGDHGGPTPTIKPLVGNPAIDHVACTGADQRGVARPQGSACDAGAVELRQGLGASGPLVLGSAQVGQQSGSATTVVTNTGELEAAVTVALIGANAAEVETVADPDACTNATVLAPAATCKLVARLAPTSAGAKTATYSVTAGASIVDVAITGTGEAVPPPSDPGGGGGDPPPPTPSATAVLVGTKTKAGKGGKLKLRLRCTAVGTDRCAGSLTLKIGARKLTRAYSIVAGQEKVVILKLAAGDRRKLVRKRSLKSAVTVVTKQPDGTRRTTQTGSHKLVR